MFSIHRKQTSWPESTSELYRSSDRSLSAKLVPTSADRGCHVVSVTDPYGRILGLLDRSRYFFFHAALNSLTNNNFLFIAQFQLIFVPVRDTASRHRTSQ
jgi:hypothetical protein